MKDFAIFKAAIVLLGVTVAGCAMQGGTPSAGPMSGAPMSSVTRQSSAQLPDGHRKLAGKYKGTVEWFRDGQASSGSLETILRLHNKNILGPFRITVNGQTKHFRLYGRIKSKTAAEATIVFLVYNTKGGYATGTGKIANGVFAGRANSAASAPQNVTMTFNVTKQ
jgi:hypothetical protein